MSQSFQSPSSHRSDCDTSRIVVVHQNGQHVSVGEQIVHALGGDLTGTRLVARNDPLHGYDVRKRRVSLLRSLDGRRMPNAGLIPALHQLAAFRDLHVQLDMAVPISSLPVPANLDYLTYPQLAQFVHAHERGIIRIPPRISLAEVIYNLAFTFPDQRIVVLGNHIRQLDNIQQQLVPNIESVQSVNGRRSIIVHEDEEMPRVTCATYLEASEIDLATCDIVLLLDAYACVQDRVQLVLERVDARFRLFGLAKSTRRVAPSEEDMGMAVFGPELLDLYGFRQSRREVNVAWISHRQPNVILQPGDHGFWHQTIWHDERRNRSIKQLAVALSTGIPLEQRKYPEVFRWFPCSDPCPRAVTILVDRPIHAVALSKMLPDWRVFTGDVPLDGCPGVFRNRIKQQKTQWLLGDKQIVLADAARNFRGATSDVVIWAGGGMHAAPVPTSWLSTQYGANKPLLIVDFLDRHNDATREWSLHRELDYHIRDIYPPGISASQGRLAKFLVRQQGEDR